MTETKSTHRIEIVPVTLEKHPNADALSIVKVWNYQVVVRTEDWQGERYGAYIPPDSIVPNHPYFEFLAGGTMIVDGVKVKSLRDKDRRITARRFRGQMSQGLLIPLSEVYKNWPPICDGIYDVGTDLAGHIGITHYEPPEPGYSKGGGAGHGKGLHHIANEPGPPTFIAPVYDMESWHRYGQDCFVDDEYVVITEKIDGTNFRAVCHDGHFYVGSHRTWKRQLIILDPPERHWLVRFFENVGLKDRPPKRVIVPNDVYSRIARMYPSLEIWCRTHPDHVIYGEVYGQGVANGSGVTYGMPVNGIDLAIFDIRKPNGDYHMYGEMSVIAYELGIGVVPLKYAGAYKECVVRGLISGSSDLYAGALREGIVIRAVDKEFHPNFGRRILKAVSPEFLEKAGRK